MFPIAQFIEAIQTVIGTQAAALHEPLFAGNEWQYVKECLDTGWVSSVGKFVDRFECDLANFTQSRHAIATVNGTAALHICYILAGIQPGDEVLVPSLTFVGTINPLMYCQAVPHFIDSESMHLGIDHQRLADYLDEITQIKDKTCINRITQRPIRALCVMHTLGHPVDLAPLLALCERYHLVLIEDAAEALGSFYKGDHVGKQGLLSALSFNGNKIITTGGGGAVLTQDLTLAKHAKHLTTTAKLPHAWLFMHDEVAYNYRLPNLNAALGCAQLETLSTRLYAKRQLYQHYARCLEKWPQLRLIREPDFAKSNYWLNAIALENADTTHRDAVLSALNQNGVMARPLWQLQHTLPMFASMPRMPLPVATDLATRLIQLPSSPQLLPVTRANAALCV